MTSTDLQPPEPSSPTRHTGPDAGTAWWIENDGLLRDEGVVYGLSRLPKLPASKVEAIVAYYRAHIARVEAVRQSLREERERLERRAADLRHKLEFLSGALWESITVRTTTAEVDTDSYLLDGMPVSAAETPSHDTGWSAAVRRPPRGDTYPAPPSGGLFRYFLGSVLALAICVLSYFVVREILGDQFEHPELIAVGVMLAGMFVVFAPTSLLFSNDRQHHNPPWGTELWKIRLAEIGFPIVAAAFVVAWGDRRDSIRDVVALLFLSMLFLLGGRLLLSLVTRLSNELDNARDRWIRHWQDKLRRRDLERIRTEGATLDQQIAVLDERIRQLRTSDELQAECEHKIAVLQSEYELARATLEHDARNELATIHAGQVEVR